MGKPTESQSTHQAEDTAEDREEHRPSARQILHAATGDRDAEAEALADQAGSVTDEEALIAVQRAHGEADPDGPQTETDLAKPSEAEAVRDERRHD